MTAPPGPQVASSDASTGARPAVARSRAFISSVNLLAQGTDRAVVLLQVIVVAGVFGASASADLYFLAAIAPFALGVIVGDPLSRAFLALLVDAGEHDRRPLAAAGLAATLLYAGIVTAVYLLIVLPLVRIATPAGTGALGPWIVFALVAPLFAVGAYLGSVLLWREKYGWSAARLPFASTVGLVLLVAAGLFGGRVVWAAAAIVGGHLVASFLLFARASHALGWSWPLRVTRPAFRAALSAGRRALPPMVGGAVGGQVVVLLERLLAAAIGTGAVAMISYARGVASAPALVSQALGAGVYPGLVRAQSVGASEYQRESFLAGLRLTLYTGTCFAAFLALFGPPMTAFLLARGEFDPVRAQAAGEIVIAFAPATLTTGLLFYLVAVLYGVGDFAAVLRRSVAVFAAYVLVAPLLGHRLGVIGLALGFSLAQAVGVVTAIESLRRRLGLRVGGLVRGAVAPALGRAAVVVAALVLYRLLVHAIEVPVEWRGVVRVGGSAALLFAVGAAVLWRSQLPEARRMRELAGRLRRR